MPTQPLGWFKKPVTKFDDFKGLKFRTVGISIDVFTGMGAAVNALPGGEIIPAMDRGLLDAAEFNNATSDRILGFPDVSKVCMLQSFHQNAEQFEILFNKTKYDALPEEDAGDHRQRGGRRVRRNVVEGDRPLFEGLHRDAGEAGRQVLQDARRGPAEAARDLRTVAAKKSGENPLFKEIVDSQKAFAARAVKWELDTYVSRRMAYNHYFGAKPRRAAAQRRADGCSAHRQTPSGRPGWCFFRAGSAWREARRRCRKLLLAVDKFSTWVGQAFAWLIVSLTLLISWEVFSRYVMSKPHAWAFDVMIMMYGTLFMMAGAYTLSKNGHVRGDVLYGFFPPRLQAGSISSLYIAVLHAGRGRARVGGLSATPASRGRSTSTPTSPPTDRRSTRSRR